MLGAPATAGVKAGLLVAVQSCSTSSRVKLCHSLGAANVEGYQSWNHESCCVTGEPCPGFGFTICQLGLKYGSGHDVLLFHPSAEWLPRGTVLRCFSEMGDELHVFETGSCTPGHMDCPCDKETGCLIYAHG